MIMSESMSEMSDRGSDIRTRAITFGLASHAAVDAHLRFFLPDGWLVSRVTRRRQEALLFSFGDFCAQVSGVAPGDRFD
jgi:hypothetical protein